MIDLDAFKGFTPEPAIDPDAECQRCNDTGFITVRNTYPMTYVCAGSPPDHARGVTEARCDRCDPVARFIDENSPPETPSE